ncbi:hypothetical protein Pint_01941 [Pistacia integerrima]|uniref:Uncharacterized protein n=1 Tax=Pistacia integerrima TaxID=434235 RepID=A0ACC0ZIC2_9ROSI|nr:hypothetical protein Pint_01941 [Pistacia integerrima]
MVNTTVTLILAMIVFSVWVAAAARTKLHSINGKEGQFASSPPTKDGICKTLVELQGYICHEHTFAKDADCAFWSASKESVGFMSMNMVLRERKG